MIVYKVTHKKTGNSYIGQTTRALQIRRSEHIRSSQQIERQKYPTPLHRALRHFGTSEFEWETLEVCSSVDQLNERERFYIKLLNTLMPNGYNQTIGGVVDGSMAEEVRDRIADSIRELHKDPKYQAKIYPKLKGLIPPNKGVPMTEAQKVKLSASNFKRYSDPSYINPNRGQKRTEEQKANIRAGQEGTRCSGEAWTAAHKDQFTPEVRAKMRERKKGKKPANTKKVQCLDTGAVYDGLTEAAKATGAPRQSIWLQIKGKLRSAGGLKFKFV